MTDDTLTPGNGDDEHHDASREPLGGALDDLSGLANQLDEATREALADLPESERAAMQKRLAEHFDACAQVGAVIVDGFNKASAPNRYRALRILNLHHLIDSETLMPIDPYGRGSSESDLADLDD